MAQRPAAAASPARHVVPFDYGASFALRGEPGRVAQDVINVSPDAVFVARAIGWGFEEERGRPVTLELRDDQAERALIHPGDITLRQFPPDALIDGLRVAPGFERLLFTDAGEWLDEPLPRTRLEAAFERVTHPVDLSFLFTMTDSSSGRELQDEPAHNIASLGIGSGERPFRPLAQPLRFLPRSTLRLQVEERSRDRRGTLFIVLYGYKLLASSACSEPVTAATAATLSAGGLPGSTPFDYVASLELTGRCGNRLEAEVPVSADGLFVATEIGYGLAAEEADARVAWNDRDRVADDAVREAVDRMIPPEVVADPDPVANWPARARVDLGDVPLRLFAPELLRDGLRIRPEYRVVAFEATGRLARLAAPQIDRVFESLNRPEDVAFRYTLFDSGVGTDLQNQALNNIAGLGSAGGERPFKRFALPLQMLPRASLRVSVEERHGRGRLYFAFHGFRRPDARAA